MTPRAMVCYNQSSTFICVDSNRFIFGLAGADPDSVRLLDILDEFNVALPRLVVQEVARTLDTSARVSS